MHGDPYRTRLHPPPSLEPFWRMIERRRRFLKAIPASVAALLLLPGLVAWSSSAADPPRSAAEARPLLGRAVVDPTAEPWGLVVGREGVAAWEGPLPTGAVRPDREASPVPLAELQRAIASQAASRLTACYRLELGSQPTLSGDLVLHLAARGRHVRFVLTGRAALRHPLGDCIERSLDDLHLPESREASWLHFPLRFTPSASH